MEEKQILKQSRSRFSVPEAVCLFLQRVPNSFKMYFLFYFFPIGCCRFSESPFARYFMKAVKNGTRKWQHRIKQVYIFTRRQSPTNACTPQWLWSKLSKTHDITSFNITSFYISKYFVFIRIFAPGLLRRYLKNWVGVDF